MIKLGDLVVFKGKGLVFSILSPFLKLYCPSWDKWGWHVGFVSSVEPTVVTSMNGNGIQYVDIDLLSNIKVYRVLDTPPLLYRVEQFQLSHIGCKYSVFTYFATVFTRLLKLRFRLWTRFYTCWTYASEFYDDMGCEITPEDIYPLLTDFPMAELVWSE